MLKLGIIADTHIPDRATTLPEWTLDRFQQEKVNSILHVGDITVPDILPQLVQVAPVLAVRGNLDAWWGFDDLPMHRDLAFENVSIGMTHGHMNLLFYLFERTYASFTRPYKASYFEKKVLQKFPHSDVILFGHIHIPVNRRVGQQLLFNPGSAVIPNEYHPELRPSIGLLHINGPAVRGEIIFAPE
jgi:hypothetical protein